MKKNKIALLLIACLIAQTCYAKTGTQNIKATYRNIRIMYNNKVQQINPEPFIIDGSVYVPLRSVGTIFDCKSQWDAKQNTVFLTDSVIFPVGGTSQSNYEDEVLRLVNIERERNNLAPLTMNEEIRKIARIKSTDMSNNNYLAHVSPTFGTPFEMLKSFGITYKSAAENIAKGQPNPQEVVAAWMNSAGHKKNILTPSFKNIGVGYNSNGNYWTQLFTG